MTSERRNKSRSATSRKPRERSANRDEVAPSSPSNATRVEQDMQWSMIESKPVPAVTLPFLYDSHVNSMILAIAVGILSVLYYQRSYATMGEALVKAVPYVTGMFVAVGLIAFPHGPFIRPHPVVWRMLFGLSLLYLVGLIAMLFLTPGQARQLLNTFDPRVGLPFKLPNYADHCELTYENVYNVMDRFVPAHFFGWFVKALMIRHRVLLWSFSIAWELLEISLIYAVPNFAECWWDQWILDVLICNGIGLELGLYVCNWLEHKRYVWSGVLEESTLVAKVRRTFLQFTPESWTTVEWESLETVKRYLQVQFLLFIALLMELNGFLLKLNLYIPTEHSWNVYRLVLICLIAMPAIRQYYLYCVDSRVKRLGSQAVVLMLICVVELALIFKTMAPEVFHPPRANVNMWIGAVLVWSVASVSLLMRRKAKNE